jgi:putative transposase
VSPLSVHRNQGASATRGRRVRVLHLPFLRTPLQRAHPTPFSDLHFPTDVVLLAVLWRLRYKLGFCDVGELLLQRGYDVTHETIRLWEFRFAPLVSARLRAKRHSEGGRSWYIDETYVKVSGRWRYLDRAGDREGNLLDSTPSAAR